MPWPQEVSHGPTLPYVLWLFADAIVGKCQVPKGLPLGLLQEGQYSVFLLCLLLSE